MEKDIERILQEWVNEGYLLYLYNTKGTFQFYDSYEDFVSEVYLIVYRKKKYISQEFVNDAHLAKYLITMIVNEIKRHKKKICERTVTVGYTDQIELTTSEDSKINEITNALENVEFSNKYNLTARQFAEDLAEGHGIEKLGEKYGCSRQTIVNLRKKLRKSLKKFYF